MKVIVLVYSLSTMVGVEIVKAKKHYWRDVFAGAAISVVSAYIFTSPKILNAVVYVNSDIDNINATLTYYW